MEPTAQRVRTRRSTGASRWAGHGKAEAEGCAVGRSALSLADVFEDRHGERVADLPLLELIELTHSLDWLLLTKRPRM